MLDESLSDDVQTKKGYFWQFEVGSVCKFFGLFIGVIEEVEQFVEYVLNKEGHVLKCELDLDIC